MAMCYFDTHLFESLLKHYLMLVPFLNIWNALINPFILFFYVLWELIDEKITPSHFSPVPGGREQMKTCTFLIQKMFFEDIFVLWLSNLLLSGFETGEKSAKQKRVDVWGMFSEDQLKMHVRFVFYIFEVSLLLLVLWL